MYGDDGVRGNPLEKLANLDRLEPDLHEGAQDSSILGVDRGPLSESRQSLLPSG